MALHAFVDESVVSNYIVAAVVVPANGVTAGRRVMRGLLRGGQKRTHFYKESDPRRAQILAGIESLDADVRVYVAKKARSARLDCLSRMVPDLAAAGVSRLVLERDDSLVEADRKVLYQLTRENAPGLTYTHLRAKEDELLWAPDAIAWCWSRGGRWRERVAAYTTEIGV
jgi:hypothetical protein